MSLSRYIAVVLVLLALAAGLVSCGGGDDPASVIDGATVDGLDSGRFAVSVRLDAAGTKGGQVDAKLDGRFQRDPKGTPVVDVDAAVHASGGGKNIDLDSGLTVFADHAFLDYKGSVYEVESANFSFARSIFLPSPEEGGNVLLACRRAVSQLSFSELLAEPEEEGTVEVDGTATTRISGELDEGALEAAVDVVLGDAGCRSQLENLSPRPLTGLRGELEDFAGGLKSSRIDVYVGEDGIVRKVSAEAKGEPGDASGPVNASLGFALSEVNEPQKIEPPTGAKPLTVLFGRLGINPFAFLTLGSAGSVLNYLWERVEPDLVR